MDCNLTWRLAIVGLVVSVLFLVGCASPRIEPLMPTPALFTELDLGPLDHIPEDRRWKLRRVYYATTRERDDDLQRIDYGNKESDEVSVGMSLIGFGGPHITWSDLNEYSRRAKRPEDVDLTIAGLLEAGKFRVGEDGAAVDLSGATSWLMSDLNASIESARDQDLLVYVHGAKVNFYNASAFAAQLDHFMGRDMTSLAFSWPTRQNIIAYGSGGDVRRAYRAAPALASLLKILAHESVARRIHIICWSAGGRVVNEALRLLHEQYPGSKEDLRDAYRLGTVYFAAADVPLDEFLETLPALNDIATRIVVTVSSNDGALKMAQTFMGGGARIGQRRQDLEQHELDRVLQADRLEVVDVSLGSDSRGFDITGHRYWISHPWASSDVILSIRSDLGPEERALEPTDFKVLWGIPANYPARLGSSLSRPDLQIRKQID